MKNEEGLIEKLREIFVTIEVFNLRMNPLEKLFYGIISLIVLSVFGALIALVIRK